MRSEPGISLKPLLSAATYEGAERLRSSAAALWPMRHKEIGHVPMPIEWVDSASPAAAPPREPWLALSAFPTEHRIQGRGISAFLSTTLTILYGRKV
jgi:hypothetical protein